VSGDRTRFISRLAPAPLTALASTAAGAGVTVMLTGLEVLAAYVVSPPYVAVRDSVPAAANVAERVAVPELSVPVPRVELPAKKVTVPVAALGATVAVKVVLAPAETEELDEVSVVVVAVEPPPVPVAGGGSQKPLQPPRRSAAIRVTVVAERGDKCTGLMKLSNMAEFAFLYRFIRGARPLRCRHGEYGLWSSALSRGGGTKTQESSVKSTTQPEPRIRAKTRWR
jgi:hypothetical protein